MADLHFGQGAAICEGLFDTTVSIIPGAMSVALPHAMNEWVWAISLFGGANHSYSLPPSMLFSTWFFLRRVVVYDVLPDCLQISILFKNKATLSSLIEDYCVPEWIPMRIQTGRPGRCLSSKDPMKLRMSRAIIEMSTACRLPFLFGKPLTTI